MLHVKANFYLTITFQHNVYLLGGEEIDAESPTGSRTVNRYEDNIN